MSNLQSAIRLVNSLSKSEKRRFQLASKKHAGSKAYLALYKLIETAENEQSISEEVSRTFSQKTKGASLEATSQYLVKVLTDLLIECKIEKDSEFNLYHNLLRVKILQERSLPQHAFKELTKLRKEAGDSQHHTLQYLTYRMQLNHFSNERFAGLSEEHLVEMQMKAKETLRMLHNIEGHHTLYETLKYRLIHSGKVVSDAEKRKLNDLLLSEISLVTGKVKNSFESKKLHLLFQSFYFSDIADYRSALKSFNELNLLFEKNPGLHESPPMDYYLTLEGILDSLRTVAKFSEMPFYIAKLRNIISDNTPDYFNYLLEKTIAIYNLSLYVGDKNYDAAVRYVGSLNPAIINSFKLVNTEKQAELSFYCSLAFFGKRDFKKAHKFIPGQHLRREGQHYMIYRALRLLNLMIHYELKDNNYLEYEIRSYTRPIQQKAKLTKCDKLILKTIQLNPAANSTLKNKILVKKIEPYIKQIREDKYEEQLLKYMDFTAWVLDKFKKSA